MAGHQNRILPVRIKRNAVTIELTFNKRIYKDSNSTYYTTLEMEQMRNSHILPIINRT